ncbi:DUF4393 domain-containing protein [Azospirillum brasilense]|uniref:DUF4393 domain-containing protein n=2 Tax=Azospirillum brasilense TaxID=192 RepID=A0A6L3B9N4_AZOBR|nr:DUF4393 domain-containing protein [Azospirillum brasilense]
MVDVLGPPLKEISCLLTDSLSYYRARNLSKIMKKTKSIVKDSKIENEKISLKNVIQILEGASLEDSEDLQDKWACLLATSCFSSEVHPSYSQILKGLTSAEVKILDGLFDGFDEQKESSLFCEGPYDAFQGPILDPYYIWDNITEKYPDIDKAGKYGKDLSYFESCLDNLFRAGLINLMPAAVPYDDDLLRSYRGPAINNRNYNNATMTHLGIGFVLACRGAVR